MKTLQKSLSKLLIFSLSFFVIALLNKGSVFAYDAEFSLYPKTGYVKVGEEFTVDINIYAPQGEIVLARGALSFDPSLIKVMKAERNDDLFCTWPSDEQSIDNVEGFLMLTGFCQSGGGNTLYQTVGEADVFARITFEVLKAGTIKLDWEYTGQDVPGKTAIVRDGSPAQNILTTKPQYSQFSSVDEDGTAIVDDGDTYVKPSTAQTSPRTGIWDTGSIVAGISVFIGSIMVFVGGAIMISLNKKYIKKKYKTLVTYE